MPWDGAAIAARPAVKLFHHTQDGINDRSCVDKVQNQLKAHGFPQAPPFTLDGGTRSADAHAWLDDYRAPMLDFFASRLP